MIRTFKPNKIIEVGSGSSTLMAWNAIQSNQLEDPENKSELICIEPYRQKWLSDFPVTIVRDCVEKLDPSFFQQLQKNDILFGWLRNNFPSTETKGIEFGVKG